MGKVTGFLEYDRQEQKYQLAGDRIRHFREFTLPLDTNDLRKQAARCMDCGIPFCHGPTGCPVQRVRDEAHRFAVTYHRQRRDA